MEITFRTVMEILGKPQEHVEKSIKEYVEKLKKDEAYEILSVDFAEIKKQEKQELWASFAELEIKVKEVTQIVNFCIDYMPSLIEIIEPKELTFKDVELSQFLNDLQAKLHGIDMVAKQVKMENDMLKNNTAGLLKNYLTILLTQKEFTADQLAQLTGVKKDRLEDFLDQLIDEGKIDLKGEVYYLKKEDGQ